MNREVKRVPLMKSALPQLTRVAAYARVSSAKDAMRHSLSAQVSYYSDLIQRHPGWAYAGVYADESAIIGLSQNPVQTGGDLALFFLFSAQFSANEGVPA